MNELAQFLAEKGYTYSPICNGEYERFDHISRPGKLDGWLIGGQAKLGDRVIYHFVGGDWYTEEKFRFRTSGTYSAEQETEINKQMEESIKRAEEFQAKRWEETATRCQAKWRNLIERGRSPYLVRKGVGDSLYGCKLEYYQGQLSTVIPVRDIEGKLWGLQYIPPDKGKKIFSPGTKKKGNFHAFRPLRATEEVIYICEGLATGASIFEALGREATVLSAFDKGNLIHAARAVRGKFATAQLIICADDDSRTQLDARPDGGVGAAHRAAQDVGGSVRRPRFKSPDVAGSDFNDLHQAEGLDAVRASLEIVDVLDEGSGIGVQVAAEPPAKKKVSEKIVAEWLLESLDGKILRQDKSLFAYDGKKWDELFEYDIDRLKNRINSMMGDKLGYKEVDSIFRTFLRYVPHVPRGRNLFLPDPTCANFLDGTLHLRRDVTTGKYSSEFLPHRRDDYLRTVLPFNYRADRTVRNQLFLDLLQDAFGTDPDRDGKLASIQELAGAMLVPAFPQMFFLHGVSGSRKSTIAKVLVKALSMENVSFLDPASMEGFMLEGMVGKLVNANLDIDDFGALPRNFLKRFEDGLPFPVNRKNKPVALARLPFVHVYCANRLPANFEGVSRALERRVTLIEFTRDLTNDNRAGEIKYYEDIVFGASPEGIYNFMLDGLDRLIANGGKFTPPGSGLAKLREWQLERDPVGLFLEHCEEAREGAAEAQRAGDKNAQIIVDKSDPNLDEERGHLFKLFLDWCKESNIDARRVSNKVFFAAMRDRRFPEKKVRGYRHFVGIGCPTKDRGSGMQG